MGEGQHDKGEGSWGLELTRPCVRPGPSLVQRSCQPCCEFRTERSHLCGVPDHEHDGYQEVCDEDRKQEDDGVVEAFRHPLVKNQQLEAPWIDAFIELSARPARHVCRKSNAASFSTADGTDSGMSWSALSRQHKPGQPRA